MLYNCLRYPATHRGSDGGYEAGSEYPCYSVSRQRMSLDGPLRDAPRDHTVPLKTSRSTFEDPEQREIPVKDVIPVVPIVVCVQCKGSRWHGAPECGWEKPHQAQ